MLTIVANKCPAFGYKRRYKSKRNQIVQQNVTSVIGPSNWRYRLTDRLEWQIGDRETDTLDIGLHIDRQIGVADWRQRYGYIGYRPTYWRQIGVADWRQIDRYIGYRPTYWRQIE